MSTNSVIAVPHGDGWHGRHVQWDGDVNGVGRHVFEIVNRDGLDVARRTFTETFYGWSTIDADRPDLSKIKLSAADKRLDSWDLRRKYQGTPKAALASWNDSGQFINVPGYGIAYSACELPDINPGYHQSRETDWFDQYDTGDWIEWAYVLADDGLWVLKGHRCEPFELLAVVAWDEPLTRLPEVYNAWAYPEGVPA